MSEEENKNGGTKSGGDKDRSFSDSFFTRLALGDSSKPASGDGNSGSNTDGSIGGTGRESGPGSEGKPIGSGSVPIENTEDNKGGNVSPSSTSESVGGTDYTGRRGRHGRDCICERCNDRRTGAIPAETSGNETGSSPGTQKRRRVSQENIPEFVDWKDIFPGMQEGKTPKLDDLLSLAYSSLFELAKFARKEDHWQLTQEEAKKLGNVTVGCINTVPLATKTKIVQKFDKYLPWIALVGFGAVITYPRIALSIELEKQRKRSRFPAPIPIRSEERDSRVTGETFRDSAGIPETGANENGRQSFPPGHLKNAPPLDYVIP